MPLIEARHVSKYFEMSSGVLSSLVRGKKSVKALEDVSIAVRKGGIVGVVGESGSGKTTLGRLLLGIEPPSSGKILFDGRDIYGNARPLNALKGKVQVIFQDPWSSVSQRLTVEKIVEEPLLFNRELSKKERRELVVGGLADVGLTPVENYVRKYPFELSGGQLQRVTIARAVVTRPSFIMADEPASMLDVSLRTGVLNLISDLRDKYDISFLFITHDLAQAMYVTDYLYVMYLGQVMEEGSTEEILNDPLSPYAASLLQSTITVEGEMERQILVGEVPSPTNLPKGCRFNSRCPLAFDRCFQEDPVLKPTGNRLVRCHLR